MLSTGTASPEQARSKMFLQQLKTTTAPQHSQLEAQELLAALMSPAVSKQQYKQYLLLMKEVQRYYESVILPSVAFVFPFLQNAKSSMLIEEDLQQLTSIIELNKITKLFSFSTVAVSIPHALGFTYVMEGSKLGGKVISKHILRTLGFTADNGAAYLSNTGADTGREWMNFLHVFSTFITSEGIEEEVMKGAGEAFGSIYHYYQSNRHVYAD